jgi:hypothetical protein
MVQTLWVRVPPSAWNIALYIQITDIFIFGNYLLLNFSLIHCKKLFNTSNSIQELMN